MKKFTGSDFDRGPAEKMEIEDEDDDDHEDDLWKCDADTHGSLKRYT
jgi:hypothetical protein